MKVTLLQENTPSGVILHFQELPGASVSAPTQKEAISLVPTEVRMFCAWSGLPTLEALWMKIGETVESPAAGKAIFASEKEPLSEEEYEALKALSLRSGEDVYTMECAVGKREENSAFLSRIGEICGAFGFAPKGEDYASLRKAFFEDYETRKPVPSSGKGEEWTLRKAFRLLAETDRQYAATLLEQAKGDAPDPFFFGDASLNFNTVTFV